MLLFPLAATAAQWHYNGDMASIGGAAGVAPALSSVATTETSTAVPAEAPTNDMRMSKVKRVFGAPEKTWPAVGKPPITRWQYPKYVVYFEYNRVITSVGGSW